MYGETFEIEEIKKIDAVTGREFKITHSRLTFARQI